MIIKTKGVEYKIMSNKEQLQINNVNLSSYNDELDEMINLANNLPDAGSSGGVTITGEPGEYVVIGSDGNPTTITAPIQYGTTEVQDGDPSPYPNGTLYIVIGE